MHIGRQYKFIQFLGWTRWEAGCLLAWSLLVTALLQVSHWNFLTIPAPVLTIIGSALAIILAFKNQQCYARFNEALSLSGQLNTNSLLLANRLMSTVGDPAAGQSGPGLKEIFYRHFAWLTALRFFLREKKPWENTAQRVRTISKGSRAHLTSKETEYASACCAIEETPLGNTRSPTLRLGCEVGTHHRHSASDLVIARSPMAERPSEAPMEIDRCGGTGSVVSSGLTDAEAGSAQLP